MSRETSIIEMLSRLATKMFLDLGIYGASIIWSLFKIKTNERRRCVAWYSAQTFFSPLWFSMREKFIFNNDFHFITISYISWGIWTGAM